MFVCSCAQINVCVSIHLLVDNWWPLVMVFNVLITNCENAFIYFEVADFMRFHGKCNITDTKLGTKV